MGDCSFHTLQFADDVLIFFDGTLSSATIIKLILDAFSESSGLKINYNKSAIIPLNLTSEESGSLADFFTCTSQSFPLMYLGLPLSPKKLRRLDYLPLIEKLDSRLAGWKCSTLSRGGRLILLNSVLSGIPSFFCSAFLLPAWVLCALEKIRRDFFWKGKKLTNGFHCLVKWENVCRPKHLGGVGVRNMRASNSALLMKGLWSFFHSPSTPWVMFLRSKHYRLRPPVLSQKAPAGCAPIWKDMLKLAAPFNTSVCFNLGNGLSLSFWSARWFEDFTLMKDFPNLYAVSTTKNASVAIWVQRFASSFHQ